MKSALLASLLCLTSCASMTPGQKKATMIVASVLVVGAIAAHDADHGGTSAPGTAALIGHPVPCFPQPNGTCR